MSKDNWVIHEQIEAWGGNQNRIDKIISLAHNLVDQVGVDPMALNTFLLEYEYQTEQEKYIFDQAAGLIVKICGDLNFRIS